MKTMKEKKETHHPFYKSKDFNICSTLFAMGKKVDSTEWQNNELFFLFEDLEECEDIVKDYYWNRLKLSPYDLFNAQKAIKSMIYS
jgi:hypothetical protein